MRMLMLGRVDIVPAFGSDPYYPERQEDSLRGQLLWLPVEGQPETLTTHVACPKSAIGAQVIQRINEALEKHGARERAQALYEQRLPPDERQRLQRMRSGIKPAERFWQDPTP
jgi:uncharacterized protein (TIGR02285 family)